MMSLERDGYAIIPRVFAPAAIDNFIVLIADLAAAPGRGGVRNLLELDGIRVLAASRELRDVIEPAIGPNCFAVRAICFDKTPDANWKVPWHQDLMVAVRASDPEARGYRAWSVKPACRTSNLPRKCSRAAASGAAQFKSICTKAARSTGIEARICGTVPGPTIARGPCR